MGGLCTCRGSAMEYLLSEAGILRADLEQELRGHQHERASSFVNCVTAHRPHIFIQHEKQCCCIKCSLPVFSMHKFYCSIVSTVKRLGEHKTSCEVLRLN